jgi:glyoxylase-like metal-dependent hydrolase (beta-lactamase superfamily II)
MALRIVQIAAGDMANFSYLVYCPATRKGIAIDPSFAPGTLLEKARQLNLTLELLINTHGHRDHSAGNGEVLAATGAILAGHPLDVPGAELALEEGSRIPLGEDFIDVLHTPGHTPGSITLHPPGALITGDTLFVTRVGRADLPGSDAEALYRSLRRLAALPPETRVYPGHDYGPVPSSTIGYELVHNPYLQCPDLPSFIRLRLG